MKTEKIVIEREQNICSWYVWEVMGHHRFKDASEAFSHLALLEKKEHKKKYPAKFRVVKVTREILVS